MDGNRIAATALALALLAFQPAWAGQALTIRAVRASSQGQGISAGLEDLKDALAGLKHSRFDLLDSQRMPLPASGRITLKGGLTLSCSGPQSALAISITQGGREILNMNLSPEDGKPVILGGFPGTDGSQTLVILVAR
jgi:hypothetical protein